MNEKFKNVPIEEDTKIKKQELVKIDKYDTLYQKWNWDGTEGESLIFLESDIKHLNDEELEHLILESKFSGTFGSSRTISRGKSKFVFVNFGFKYS